MKPTDSILCVEFDGLRGRILAALFLWILVSGLVSAVALGVVLLRRPLRWPARVRRLRRQAPSRQMTARVAVGLLIWYLAALAGRPILEAWLGTGTRALVLQSLLFNMAGLALVGLILTRRGISWRRVFGGARLPWSARLGLGMTFYLAAMPLVWFYALIYQAALRAHGYSPAWQEVVQAFTDETSVTVRLLLFLLAVGLAPIFEELLFRGLLLPLAVRRLGVTLAIIAVSALFAVLHFHGPSLVPLFLIAAAFSLGYLASGSLWVPIVMHALFNGVNLVLLTLVR